MLVEVGRTLTKPWAKFRPNSTNIGPHCCLFSKLTQFGPGLAQFDLGPTLATFWSTLAKFDQDWRNSTKLGPALANFGHPPPIWANFGRYWANLGNISTKFGQVWQTSAKIRPNLASWSNCSAIVRATFDQLRSSPCSPGVSLRGS